jgi:Protein of unknown function (DUF1592)/Protein of unknown function (DUF1588)/Protein of unknown function (DUF1585)/Protein of unknown function (DUF1595)/Protein of unknown function (DUF1587)
MTDSVNRRWWARARWGASLLTLSAAACSSSTTHGGGGPNGTAGSGTSAGGTGSTIIGTGGSAVVIAQGEDPGRVEIHRLNNLEYDNTVRDLLGTATQPATKFLAEEGLNFDNTATALGMTSSQYDAYFGAARDLLTEASSTPAELMRFMTCMPGSAAADACAKQIVETFGAKIYRRPLDPSESARAMKVFDADIARGGTGSDALLLTVRAMLSAANFLYRVEYDPNPTSTAPHALSGYELASRLSYLGWSTMPDDALFAAAKDGSLLQSAALEAQVDRLLADGKATAFIESFAGQWLDIRKLITHSVTPSVFTTYTAELSDAMSQEGYLWFQEFVNQNRPLSDWFTADFNFVNDTLAQHYGMPAPGSGAQMTRVTVTTDQRKGFFGLASFLTQTSFPSRTSPTLRGAWVLSELLCAPPPPPPNNVPKLDASATPAEMMQPAGTENVKQRLERHRSDPICAGCHKILDPIGLGLERFDGIGRYREAYGNGDPIDPAGVLPDGTAFAGADQLAALIGQDPRFPACVEQKLLAYALGRDLEAYDMPSLTNLQTKWTTRGLTIRNLMKEVVLSAAFRARRGEAP